MHNVRSAHNAGSILRTAEGLGIDEVYLTGYTPYPESKRDKRLPHKRKKQAQQIHKTALGAEYFVEWHQADDIDKILSDLKDQGFWLVALEQAKESAPLNRLKLRDNLALVVGNEITGLDKNVLKKVHELAQIPMAGRKESFNVAVATALALYHLSYISSR